ncbi:MAG: DNA/RNA nuclease SfsA, partial [candidate division NC10 bacterium]|nr:DNA/RNA nuclease SfsA [candidate division NC10 bacterium]
DPEFTQALRRASRAGVCVCAMRCRVEPKGVRLDRPVPARLDLVGPKAGGRERG